MTSVCPVCRQSISPKAVTCPGCGHPFPSTRLGIASFVLSVLATVGYGAMMLLIRYVEAISPEVAATPPTELPDGPPLYFVGLFGALLALAGYLVGLSLGIEALFAKNRRKPLAIAGVIVNGLGFSCALALELFLVFA